MLAAFDDALNSLAQGLVLFALIPSGYFVIDYVVIRPLLTAVDPVTGSRIKKWVPWWRSGIGIMFAMLGLSFFLTNVVISLSLGLGTDYPYRQVVRVVLYGFCAVAVTVMAVVYAIEGSRRSSVLMGKEND